MKVLYGKQREACRDRHVETFAVRLLVRRQEVLADSVEPLLTAYASASTAGSSDLLAGPVRVNFVNEVMR